MVVGRYSNHCLRFDTVPYTCLSSLSLSVICPISRMVRCAFDVHCCLRPADPEKRSDRKELPFEGDGQIVVYRLGDTVHATSAFCTHYGAPLAKGVLTADGRVVWWVTLYVIRVFLTL